MRVDEVIEKLKTAEVGSRKLDAMIAGSMGWVRVLSPKTVTNIRTLWRAPARYEPIPVPYWTTNVQDAYDLAQELSPGHVGAFTWSDDGAKAQIGETAEQVEAATVELAICAAALLVLSRRPVRSSE